MNLAPLVVRLISVALAVLAAWLLVVWRLGTWALSAFGLVLLPVFLAPLMLIAFMVADRLTGKHERPQDASLNRRMFLAFALLVAVLLLGAVTA